MYTRCVCCVWLVDVLLRAKLCVLSVKPISRARRIHIHVRHREASKMSNVKCAEHVYVYFYYLPRANAAKQLDHSHPRRAVPTRPWTRALHGLPPFDTSSIYSAVRKRPRGLKLG